MSDHWNRKDGSLMSLYTYTNAEEVELYVNDKSLGVKNNTKDPKRRNKLKWDKIKYEKGYIEAVARTGGKIVARHKIETTTDATTLKAETDNTEWKSDGMDLQHIHVVAVDKKGRRVQGVRNKLKFSVEGPAEIVGVINGDITSDELTIGDSRSLYNGTATVILRSTKEPGKVSLTVTADGLKTAKVVMKTL